MTIKGQDWSSYQSSTPSTSGLSFAFIKATEGTGYTNPKMASQAKHARANGLLVGFYHFVQPGDMKAQAKYFVDKADSVEGDTLWLDWEVPGVSSAQKDEFLAELKTLRGATHKYGLYCSQSYWTTRDKSSKCGDALWIAQYNGHPGQPSIQHAWVIHQYTSTPIDTNVAQFASKAAMKTWQTKSTSGTPAKTTTPDKTTPAKTTDSKELDMNAADVYKAVWGQDKLAAPTSSSTKAVNKSWEPGNMLRETYDRIAELHAAVDALSAKVEALSTKEA